MVFIGDGSGKQKALESTYTTVEVLLNELYEGGTIRHNIRKDINLPRFRWRCLLSLAQFTLYS